MRRRDFLYGMGGLAGLTACRKVAPAPSETEQNAAHEKVVGMYIHQHWPYNHPYAARTWTVEDYRGYASGLKRLGYNTLVIWPLIEIMPNPLTPSDRGHLKAIGNVIDMLHNELEMKAYIALCPNFVANAEAPKSPFDKRHFFYCDQFVNPADPAAVKSMIDWRRQLMTPFAKIDGVAIIDSDPGGYPGSTNSQFVDLLEAHRHMLDSLRPGIELVYWMHVGWEAYCHYYETGNFAWGTPEASRDVLSKLKRADPRPWTITIHTYNAPPNGTDLKLAEQFGLAATCLAFNYGAIEGEPTYPMTNFGGDAAFQGGQKSAPGGVVGNAQTHCVQLPNTFAFARGATGKSQPRQQDYVAFAEELLPGNGPLVVEGWRAISQDDPAEMRSAAGKLDALATREPVSGPLRGLLFGNAQRFLTDLSMELQVRAGYQEFVSAAENHHALKGPFRGFVEAASAWQERTGYQCAWRFPKMAGTLKMLHSPTIDAVLDEQGKGKTPFDRIADHYRITETYTPRLLAAMQQTLKRM